MTMKNLPFMPMYWGEYIGATVHFTAAQHGAYILLIAFYWQNGKLPDDENFIRKIAKVSTRDWPRVRAAVAPMFEHEQHGRVIHWRHRRVEHELAQATEITRAKRDTLTSTYTHTKTVHGHSLNGRKANGRKSVQQAAREQLEELEREIEREKADRTNSRH